MKNPESRKETKKEDMQMPHNRHREKSRGWKPLTVVIIRNDAGDT